MKRLDVEYVYAGAMLHEDRLVHSYVRVTREGLGEAVAYEKQMSKHKVGSVVRFVAMDTPDNLIADSGQFLRVWSDRKQCAEWTAMSTAVLLSEEAYIAAKAKPNSVLELLEPLRIAYTKLGERERAVLLSTICAYIVGED